MILWFIFISLIFSFPFLFCFSFLGLSLLLFIFFVNLVYLFFKSFCVLLSGVVCRFYFYLFRFIFICFLGESALFGAGFFFRSRPRYILRPIPGSATVLYLVNLHGKFSTSLLLFHIVFQHFAFALVLCSLCGSVYFP